MNKNIAILSLVGLVAAGGIIVTTTRGTGQRQPVASANARATLGVKDLVSAVPFVLEKPATHWWRKEQPTYDAGWLVVLAVDPSLVVPRQVAEPVLYAGSQTVERVNHGEISGRVVAVIPSVRGADGQPVMDWNATPFFFGSEELPERIDAGEIRLQLGAATRNGELPFTPAVVAAARAKGGAPLHLAAREELDERLALLVLEHSPEEQDLATGMLAPRVK